MKISMHRERSYQVCVNVNNLPENQVYSFYNLFGACAVFVDCADSKIYQSFVECSMPTHYMAVQITRIWKWNQNIWWKVMFS